MTTQALVPNDPDLFRIDGDDAVLLGSRCPKCELRFFPHRWECPIDGTFLEPAELAREGLLHVATYVHMPAYGKAQIDAEGYGVGQIDLPGEVRIQAILVGDPAAWTPGTRFRSMYVPMGEPSESGVQKVGFRFARVEVEDA
jgi:uncharacterized OB-fold protein